MSVASGLLHLRHCREDHKEPHEASLNQSSPLLVTQYKLSLLSHYNAQSSLSNVTFLPHRAAARNFTATLNLLLLWLRTSSLIS